MGEILKSKDFVNLRQRKRPNGRVSLYLDICVDGVRRYEYLKLYLMPEVTRADKAANKETMRLAEAMKAQRVVEMQSRQFGLDIVDSSKVLFYDFIESLINRKEGTTKTSWKNCMAHLLRYEPNRSISFKDITPVWVQGFRDYLDFSARQWDIDTRKRNVEPKPISQGTKALMFQKLCSVLNLAVRQGMIASNPSATVERFKEPESDREFLTVEELRKLTATPPPDKEVARAFLFSCLTGLRWSDIVKLRWSNVQKYGESTRIVFTQQKTGGHEYLDLTPQAVDIIGERGKKDEKVFPNLTVVQTARINVTAWVNAAGIDKHITFHSGRHTFAIMMLDIGVDLYTVSKLLGHKSIETTQIYAKILDKNKQAAVNKIPSIFA
ncbi:MAG: site-specific integrase [Muribaculaceae bacterium]|nr:site-specific integrase [Muribaculaceae bacterium]